jgi:hypothetical protein
VNHLRTQWKTAAGSEDPLRRVRRQFRTLCEDCAKKLGATPEPGPSFTDTCSECDRTLPCRRYRVPKEAALTKQAPSWRPYQNDEPFWTWHDAVIATDKAGSRRTFETWVDGFPFTRGHTLVEAKGYIETKLGFGPLVWHTQRMEPSEIDHYYFGPTTEFTEPLTLYWADRP